jgi:hypothetical protein
MWLSNREARVITRYRLSRAAMLTNRIGGQDSELSSETTFIIWRFFSDPKVYSILSCT